jgi:RNA polymerase sigma factor (sigma-70 family)
MPVAAVTTAGGVSDRELVVAARGGDATSLGLLLERYRASLYGVALQMLGNRAEAEDAVHETFLVALRRLNDVRDPAAIGGWLHAVARNVCLMELRGRRREVLVAEPQLPQDPARLSIEQEIERLALRDWVWAALDRLSPTLRLTVMLRHFARVSSYEEIASICGVPVGTVRSRLNEARLKLADTMLDAAALADSEARALTKARTRDVVQAAGELNRHENPEAFLALLRPDVRVTLGRAELRGHGEYARVLASDLEAGVKMRLVGVLAGRGVTIVEGQFVNPADDPFHCPPEITLVLLDNGEEAHSMRAHLGERVAESS